jgi:hypothetical protein
MRRFHIGSPEWSPPRVPLQLPLGFGSLGWLAHLIRKHKLDLTEVDLAPVAQACYDYWREVGDMDEASDALATLAYLTERKAQRCSRPTLSLNPTTKRSGSPRRACPTPTCSWRSICDSAKASGCNSFFAAAR